VSEIDLCAALQRSLDRHQSLRAEAQAAQEPRSAPPEGEDSGDDNKTSHIGFGEVGFFTLA